MCAVCAPLCMKLSFPDSLQQQHTMEQRQEFHTLMTSKGPVQTGPKQAAEKPEPIDWSKVSCMPSPSCLPHNKLQREHTAVASLVNQSTRAMHWGMLRKFHRLDLMYMFSRMR